MKHLMNKMIKINALFTLEFTMKSTIFFFLLLQSVQYYVSIFLTFYTTYSILLYLAILLIQFL